MRGAVFTMVQMCRGAVVEGGAEVEGAEVEGAEVQVFGFREV